MAYYVGTQQFPSIYEASRFLAQNPQPGVTITSAPVAPAGMLTKPAPITKQTAPVGTPSTPPKQMPGESGPFDPNAPVPTPAPAPAPAPQQTGPVGMPSSDPTKTQPGETGPFDPNAEPPAPAPAPEPEAELAPPKPLPDTKDAEPAPEPEGITTFTFFEGVELGDANPDFLYKRGDATQVTESELREYFNAQGSQMLKQAFNDFDNYLAYMTEREQLIQAGDYDVGNWDEYTGGLTEDQLMILEGEDLTQYSDSDQDVYTEAYGQQMQEQSSAYDRWVNSEANQALLAKYGVEGTMYNSDGDSFKWNGSAYVKTNKIDDSVNIGDIAKLGFGIALSVVATPAIASAIAPNAVAGSAAALSANAAASSIVNAATQLLTTGQIDPEGALRAAATSFLSNTAMNSLKESGVFGQIGDAVNSTTTDQLVSANGDVLGQVVRDAAGNIIESTGVDSSVWFALASETGAIIQEGQTIVSQIASVMPEVPDWLYDATQATVNVVDSVFNSTRSGIGASATGNLNFEPSDVSFIDQLREAIEREEDPEVRESLEQELSRYEELPEEDILADTTQEATGFEDSVVRELLDEYIQPVLASLEDQDLETAGIQTAIGTLTEQQQETLQEFVRQGGQIEELDSNQQQIIEDLGGVNEVVSDLAENVSGLEEGLQQAATEREDIRASQEAGFTQAEQDRQRLMEAIVEARGQTTELSQEMRDLLAQSNQTMQEMFEGTGVDIDELRSGQLSQEEATNALREYTQQEFGAVREELAAGLTEAQQERQELMEAWIAANGNIENLSEEMRDRFEATNQTVEELFAGTNVDIQELRDGQISQAQATDALREYTEQELGVVREELQAGLTEAQQERYELAQDLIEVGGLVENLDAASQERFDELDITVDSLAEEFGVDFDRLEQGLLSAEEATDALQEYAEEEFGVVREEIAGVESSLRDAIEAAQQGQTRELTEAEARLLSEITGVEAGVLQQLSTVEGGLNTRLNELGTDLGQVQTQLETSIAGVRGEVRDVETSLRDALQAQSEGQTRELTEAEARLLSEITGVEAGVLQQLSTVEGALNTRLNNIGTDINQVQTNLESSIAGVRGEVRDVEASLQDALEAQAQGQARQLTEAEARLLAEITGGDAELLREMSAQTGGLQEQLNTLGVDITDVESRLGQQITGLEERIDANTAQQLEELTGLRSEFLATLSASEAAAIARNQGLSDQLTEQITGVRGETAAQIEGINDRLTNRIDAYEQQTGEQLDIAAEERAELGGQLGTLTTDVARVAEDVIRAGGRIEELDEASRQRYEELGLSIDELSLRVGVNLNALSEGMLTQDAALRELIEETTQQTEQSLTERLEEAEQGFATSLSDTEANLLSQITGVESGVLQQLAEVEGGLQSQFGEQFDVVQQQVSGLGEQVTGLGEGITGLGQALGVGLLGLAAAQPTAQEIASAMPRQPVEFDPFLKGLSPFQPLTPIALAPQKQTDALSELNKFIGRQTGMLV